MIETYGSGFSHKAFDEKCRASMHIRLADAVPVKAGAIELVSALRELDVPLAVAISSRSNHALAHLRAAGVFDFFDTIVTRDDVTNPKPHPEPYLMAAERLKVDPLNCVAFEDSIAGVRAAHAAGMRTVMVPDLVVPGEEVTALCVAVLETLTHAHDHMISGLRAANRSQLHLQVKSRG